MAAGIWRYWAVRGAIVGTISGLIFRSVFEMIAAGSLVPLVAWRTISIGLQPDLGLLAASVLGPPALLGLIVGMIFHYKHSGFRRSAAIGFLTGLVPLLALFGVKPLCGYIDTDECEFFWAFYLTSLTLQLLATGTFTGVILAWMNLRQSRAAS